MNTPIRLIPAFFLSTALVGCDDEHSPMHYDAIAHFDLRVVRDTPWIAAKGQSVELGGALSRACGQVLAQADAITLGLSDETVEVYVANAPSEASIRCLEGLEANAEGWVVRTKWLGSTLGVVMSDAGAPSPSAKRMASLCRANPSPRADQPVWFTVHKGAVDGPFEYAEGWVDLSEGLVAHASAQFATQAEVASLATEAAVALVALRVSPKTAPVAKGITTKASSDTFTVDVRVSEQDMHAVLADAKLAAEFGGQSVGGDSDGTLSIQVR